jgi:hypothetical protein
MKRLVRNVGTTDRIVRAAIGAILTLWAAGGGPVVAWLGLVLLATAAAGRCPAYQALGRDTRQVESHPKQGSSGH